MNPPDTPNTPDTPDMPDMPDMPDTTSGPEDQRFMLSRLIDGDVDADDAAQASAQWRVDAVMRSTWHCYQLIGDAMRSEDLVSTPKRDAEFLTRLRTRLQQEVLAVAPAEPVNATAKVIALPSARRAGPLLRWLAPAAVAAGFAVVAGVLVVTRFSSPGLEPAVSTQMAMQRAAPGLQRAATGTALPSSSSTSIEVMDAALVRDAQIDRYFRAHRDMRSNAAAALPGGALRSVDTIVPQR